ncbi:uncharacterized protein GIQ15_02352 [Arthroderma uncinatum]|uniref:uncharacterized protein n=1 Tax=Arthroderma uncinatum TaxID=74035 RepID=UPI00144AEB84|nr:uncharacterized protein GIQ15_02352 [Arthroderma uncinatum]KAF3483028.1 hypothetical protein GIQ15_02352 [Arthroderma uncinatum]
MMVFDDVLDPEKLRSTLCMLAEREGWQKIGARLKRRWNGRLEYHIPSEFTSSQPAIRFSQELYGIDIKDHPIASHISDIGPAEYPFVVAHSEAFVSLAYDQKAPKTAWGFCDGMGMKSLLHAWTLLLQDPEAKVPVPYGADTNPLATLGQNPTEPYRCLDQRLSKWQKLVGVSLRLPRFLLYQRINRVVCVPSSLIASLRKEALKDIGKVPNAKTSFVSENDILFAWWARIVFSCTPRNRNHKINLITTASRRGPLSKDLLPSDSVYLSNAIGFLQTLVTRKELLDEPLGYTAYRIRRTIQQDNTREQIEAQEALAAKSILGLPAWLGDLSTEALLSASQGKVNLYSLDFSGARKDQPSKPNSPVRPYYCQNFLPGEISHIISPNCLFFGKDANGNYWISATLRRTVWDRVEEALSESDCSTKLS